MIDCGSLAPWPRSREQLDHFLRDSIEPVPTGREIAVEVTDPSQDRSLVLSVRGEASRRPYAFVQGLVREFLLREGDRVRPMRREEILASGSSVDPADSNRALGGEEDRTAWLQAGRRGLWLRVSVHPPATGLAIRGPQVKRAFLDASGQRNLHPLYHFGFGRGPRRTASAAVFESGTKGDHRWVKIAPTGTVSFFADLPVVGELGPSELPGWLVTLYVVSALRRVSHLFRELQLPGFVVQVATQVFEISGHTLEPGPPWNRIPWTVKPGKTFEGRHLEPTAGLEFSREEFLSEPDLCAFRTLRRIFAVFGFPETAIPWFDSQSRRFERPD